MLKPNSAQCQQGKMRDNKDGVKWQCSSDGRYWPECQELELWADTIQWTASYQTKTSEQIPVLGGCLFVGLRLTGRQKRMKKGQWTATVNTITNNSTSNHLLWEPVEWESPGTRRRHKVIIMHCWWDMNANGRRGRVGGRSPSVA